ncbi:methionyl-tRNA formyltransferase [Flagellimonas allohymeniacidonis]|uniref:Methionyl-tRNA formyltransferase n=1 Tax=Flagellimonas allohymeniacidonis TaxID=2517819 RepID=A0A4Q8QIS7_9FLAO|nr:methionyl-tRNA formyltransferase [Allomuricauda hymeniacidonis]TAI48613.1 methionyl-tRNA formyltransferase [Allomuricauda hymeniacidonis]
MSAKENRALRIVFMGTPDFAVGSLKALLRAGFNVVGVITAPDRPAGRGRKIQESAVKRFAKEKEIPILQPTKLKSEVFLKELRELEANLQVVVAFRMLPQVVWQMPEYGTFNLHASLLPQYRGAAPINWAIINGETETGVTTFFIDEKIDTGHIILQESEVILPSDSAGSLHDRLMVKGSQLVVETCRLIAEGDLETKPQKHFTKVKQAPKIHKDTCRIDWTEPLDKIHDHIRGLSPYPGAWTFLVHNDEQMTLKVFASRKEFVEHDQKIGAILSNKKSLKVATKNGCLELLEIQIPGKRRMKTSEVLQGFQLNESSHMR